MKKRDLHKLILECIDEVLDEATYEVKPEDVDKIKNKIDKEKDTVKIVQEKELDEMARIAQPYRLSDDWQEKLDAAGDGIKNNRWIKGIIEYLQEVGEATTIKIATEKFNTRQQQINPLMKPLVDLGILTQGDKPAPTSSAFLRQLAHPEKVKKKAKDDYGGVVFGGGEYGGDDDELSIVEPEDIEALDEPTDYDYSEEGDEEEVSTPYISPEADEISAATSELAALKRTKDDLIRKYKSGKLSLGAYKAEIGDIPERIKELEKIVNPSIDDDTLDENIKLKWQKIAGIR